MPAEVPQQRTQASAREAAAESVALAVTWAICAFAVSVPAATLAVADRPLWAAIVVGCLLAASRLLAAPWRNRSVFAGAAFAVGALWGLFAYDGVQQSTSGLRIQVADPARLDDQKFRRGQGRVLVDLRRLEFPTSSMGAPPRLSVSAQSDTNDVIIALPERTCLRLVVHYRRIRLRPSIFDQLGGLVGLSTANSRYYETASDYRGGGQSEGQGMEEQYARDRRGAVDLAAYGRPIEEPTGTWVRDATDPQAPTLEINAAAGGQVIVRNYPTTLSLAVGEDQTMNYGWPLGQFERRPTAPDGAHWATNAGETSTLLLPDGRDITDAYRASLIAWGRDEAARYAGPCATPEDLAARVMLLGRGTPVRDGLDEDTEVYANGLGQFFVERERDGSLSLEPLR